MSMRARITFRPPPSSRQLEERRIIEEPDRFAVQAEAAQLPFRFLILHPVFLHLRSPFQSELDPHGPARQVRLERDARLGGEVRHSAG